MPAELDLTALTASLRRQGELVAHTVYECNQCGERYVGERRCPNCGYLCQRLGLGGYCPECDHALAIVELLAEADR